jgi:hypothetical protein
MKDFSWLGIVLMCMEKDVRKKDKFKCRRMRRGTRGTKGSNYRKYDGWGSGIYEITRTATRSRGAHSSSVAR